MTVTLAELYRLVLETRDGVADVRADLRVARRAQTRLERRVGALEGTRTSLLAAGAVVVALGGGSAAVGLSRILG